MEPYRRKVRYWDVDSNAHVFNVRYLVYVDDALTDFLEDSGYGFDDHPDAGYLLVLARTEIDYLSEAVIGDILATTVKVDRVGNTSITFGFEIIEEGTQREVARGRQVYVAIGVDDHEPVPIPDDVRSTMTSG